MARHETLTLQPGVAISAASAVAGATIANTGTWSFRVIPSATAGAPATDAGAIPLAPGEVILSTTLFAEIWPGIAVSSVWLICEKLGEAQVSHA